MILFLLLEQVFFATEKVLNDPAELPKITYTATLFIMLMLMPVTHLKGPPKTHLKKKNVKKEGALQTGFEAPPEN